MPSHHQDIARRYLGDVWSRGRLEAMHELVDPSCTVRDPLFGCCVGTTALGAYVREMRRAFPDLAWSVDEILADAGPQLALSWSATARSSTIKVTGLLLLRFEDEKLIAITAHWDPHDLLRASRSPAPALPPLSRAARGSTPAISVAPEESELDSHWDD